MDITFDDVLERALQLTAAEQARLLERLATEVREALDDTLVSIVVDDDEEPLTPDEIERLLHSGPKTGAEWVNEQKRKRLERKKW